MRRVRVAVLCTAMIVVAALVWRRPAVRPPLAVVHHPWKSTRDPFTPEALRARMERIAPLVSEVVGFPIDLAKLHIRAVDDRVAAEREFEEESPELLDTTRDEFRVESVWDARALASKWASVMGIYHAKTGTIELTRVHFDLPAPDRIDAVFDIVVAHELAHAWQDQQFGVFDNSDTRAPREVAYARSAVIEGSAEFVARAVARKIGQLETFDTTAAKRADSFTSTRARRPTMAWFYTAGLEFIEALHTTGGDAPDWERLFRDPPRFVSSIERPREWLDAGLADVESLDDWAERFIWCVDVEPAQSSRLRNWHCWPTVPACVKDRVDLLKGDGGAGEGDLAVWTRCRGGFVVVGEPVHGGLSGVETEFRVWRFESESEAQQARTTLERAAARRGAPAWMWDPFADHTGSTRWREGKDSAAAYSQSGVDGETGEAREAICALAVQGPFVLEAVAECVGAAPALLDLLETARRAFADAEAIDRQRDRSMSGPWADVARLRTSGKLGAGLPDQAPGMVRDEIIAHVLALEGGEAEVADWLRSRARGPGASIAALAPAAGSDSWKTPERGETLIAALSHPDPDVRRFALGRLGNEDLEVRPFAADVVRLVLAASSDPDAEIRALAVRASNALVSEAVLDREAVELLLADPSPLVRATLAGCSALLQSRDVDLLRADGDETVRHVAEQGGRRRSGSPLSWSRRSTGAPQSDSRTAADLEFLWSLRWRDLSEQDRAVQLAHLRDLLGSSNLEVRISALVTSTLIEGDCSVLAPALLNAFENGLCRRMATDVLVDGDLDLTAVRSRLLRMLDNPFCRTSALRVIAAHGLELEDAALPVVESWLDSPDSGLACAAALAIIDDRAHDATGAREVLADRWEQVHSGLRAQIVRAVLRRDPESSWAARIRDAALLSPFEKVRSAVFDSTDSVDYSPAQCEALLRRISQGGSEVSGECWMNLARLAEKHPRSFESDGVDRLVRHLNEWCGRDRLPVLRWRRHWEYEPDFDDWPRSPKLLPALDRCLLRSDEPGTRLVLALLRDAMSPEEIPPSVRVRMEELFAASIPPNIDASGKIHDVVARRAAMSTDVVAAVLRRRAAMRWRRYGSYWSSDALLDGAARQAVGWALVPEFLSRGTQRSVSVAVEILSRLPAADATEPELIREYAPRALPSWRDKLSRGW